MCCSNDHLHTQSNFGAKTFSWWCIAFTFDVENRFVIEFMMKEFKHMTLGDLKGEDFISQAL